MYLVCVNPALKIAWLLQIILLISGGIMNEASKNKPRIEHLLKGYILDIGSGGDPIHPDAVLVDNVYKKTPNVTLVCDAMNIIFPDGYFDVVHSSHCLEDLENTEMALMEWGRLVRLNGYLILYLPHRDYYPNIGQPHANTDHKHDFIPSDITSILEKLGGWKIITNETFPPPNGIYDPRKHLTDEYSFLIVAQSTYD